MVCVFPELDDRPALMWPVTLAPSPDTSAEGLMKRSFASGVGALVSSPEVTTIMPSSVGRIVPLSLLPSSKYTATGPSAEMRRISAHLTVTSPA